MIHCALSPNTEQDDLWKIFTLLLRPWTWYRSAPVEGIEQSFEHIFPGFHAISFERGRDALFVLLKALIQPGDEVILQAYTCTVVPNAIIAAGGRPVYADIEAQGFNVDVHDIERKISPKTKAVIIQHTFGEPADVIAIQKLAKERRIFLIEDCAHGLSGSFQGSSLGSFGDAALFSFGRDKIISGVWGGMLTVKDPDLAEKCKRTRDQLPIPSPFQILQSLLHPLVFAMAKPFYGIHLGKLFVEMAKKLRLIPPVIYPAEKNAAIPFFMPQRMPGGIAELILHQLKKLDRFHMHRKSLAEFYHKGLEHIPGITVPKKNPESAWLRYTILTERAPEIFTEGKKRGISFGDWYRSVLGPKVDESLFGYQKGSCLRAEKVASQCINLPTHIQTSERQAEEIVHLLRTH